MFAIPVGVLSMYSAKAVQQSKQRDSEWTWSVGAWAANRVAQAFGTLVWALTHHFPIVAVPSLITFASQVHDDSAWFEYIADRGYIVQDTVFWPAYPMALRLVHFLSGWPLHFCGLLVSNVATVCGCYVLYRLFRSNTDERSARLAVSLWVLFPAAMYLTNEYTEAMFTAAFWGAILAVERRRWVLAGVFGALACLTRNTGVLVLIAWVPEVWSAFRERRIPWREITSAAGVVASVAGYCGYLWVRWGDPLAFSHMEYIWGRQMMAPWITLWRGILAIPWLFSFPGYSRLYYGVEYVSLAFMLISLPLVWRHCPRSWFWITAAMVIVPLSAPGVSVSWMVTPPHRITDYFFSLFRFVVPMVPIFSAWARVLSGRLVPVWFVCSSTCLAACSAATLSHLFLA